MFVLDTDAVADAASEVESLKSRIQSVSSSVSGYDTSAEDGFNFAGAKSLIASNIQTAMQKISNTSTIMTDVVDSHSRLQTDLKFEIEKPEEAAPDTFGNNQPGSYAGTTPYYSSPVSSAPVAATPTYTPTDPTSPATTVPTDPTTPATTEPTPTEETSTEETPTEGTPTEETPVEGTPTEGTPTDETPTEGTPTEETPAEETPAEGTPVDETVVEEPVLKDKPEKVDYAYISDGTLPEESQALFEHVTYDDGGYGVVEGKYVIACDESYGKVGDVIKFTQNDGTVVECVVGVNTTSTEGTGTINFVVDKEIISEKGPAEFSSTLVENNTKVENYGQLEFSESIDTGTSLEAGADTGTGTSTTPSTDTTPDAGSGTPSTSGDDTSRIAVEV